MVLIAANLRHMKITDNLFGVLCFFMLLTKGRIVILFHTLSFSLHLIFMSGTYVPKVLLPLLFIFSAHHSL